MKKTILFLLLPFFLLTTSQAHTTIDKPTFFKQARARLNKHNAYLQFKRSGQLNPTAFQQVEETMLNYVYFNKQSRIAYFNHMSKAAVKKGLFSAAEMKQLKAIVNAASMQNAAMSRKLVNAFAKSATTGAGKAVAKQLLAEMQKIDAEAKDGRQSLAGFWQKLGRLVGTVVGAIAGGISGGIAGAIAGALAGGKLGSIIGDAIDGMKPDGVWAGPDGTHCDTPPFCG